MADAPTAVSYVPLLQTAIGGALAIAGAFGGAFYVERLKTNNDRRRMASAFAGEICGILEIAKVRQVKEQFEYALNHYSDPKNPVYEKWVWPMTDEYYFQVYRGNVDKIGLFDPPIPNNIAIFYTLSFGIVEDLKNMGEHIQDRKGMIAAMRNDLEIIGRIEELGQQLVIHLEKIGRQK